MLFAREESASLTTSICSLYERKLVPSLLDSVFSSAACLLLYLITVFSAEFWQASAFEVSLSTLVSQDSVLWDTCRQQMSRQISVRR